MPEENQNYDQPREIAEKPAPETTPTVGEPKNTKVDGNLGRPATAEDVANSLGLGSPDPDYDKRVKEWFENGGYGSED